jgi:hypothetical protein
MIVPKTVAKQHEAYELIHPLEFQINLMKTLIDQSKAYFLEHNINPYENVKVSSDWMEMNCSASIEDNDLV